MKVSGASFTDNSAEVLEALKEQSQTALEAIGNEAEGYAKEECPVDTGRLRNSISNAVSEGEVYIGTNVEYAPYVEYGEKARHQTGKAHFLRDAAVNHGEHYKDIMRAYLESR